MAVVTTDYEGPILQRARAFVEDKHPGSGTRYARVDAKALPFLNERFDVVLSLYVLHHAMGYRAALMEIARVSDPGGLSPHHRFDASRFPAAAAQQPRARRDPDETRMARVVHILRLRYRAMVRPATFSGRCRAAAWWLTSCRFRGSSRLVARTRPSGPAMPIGDLVRFRAAHCAAQPLAAAAVAAGPRRTSSSARPSPHR